MGQNSRIFADGGGRFGEVEDDNNPRGSQSTARIGPCVAGAQRVTFVAAETKKRVEDAIRTLNYLSNSVQFGF